MSDMNNMTNVPIDLDNNINANIEWLVRFFTGLVPGRGVNFYRRIGDPENARNTFMVDAQTAIRFLQEFPNIIETSNLQGLVETTTRILEVPEQVIDYEIRSRFLEIYFRAIQLLQSRTDLN